MLLYKREDETENMQNLFETWNICYWIKTCFSLFLKQMKMQISTSKIEPSLKLFFLKMLSKNSAEQLVIGFFGRQHDRLSRV